MIKNKYMISVLFVLFLLGVGIFFFDGGRLFSGSGKIGGWDEIEQKLSKRFSYNEDLKKAALQMGIALQAAIDNPEDAERIVVDLSDAMDCVRAILEEQGKRDQASDTLSEIEDISTGGFSRERRYIRFNANLSGGVYELFEASVSKCHFKTKQKSK